VARAVDAMSIYGAKVHSALATSNFRITAGMIKNFQNVLMHRGIFDKNERFRRWRVKNAHFIKNQTSYLCFTVFSHSKWPPWWPL
jgi:hypothetical protein